MTNELARRLNALRDTLSSFIDSPQSIAFNHPEYSYDPIENPKVICDNLEVLRERLFPNYTYTNLCSYRDYDSIPQYILSEVGLLLDIITEYYPQERDYFEVNIFLLVARYFE